MAAIILDVKISKTQQLSNWEADELSESQQKYAATDAWICREMYLKLLRSKKNPLTPEQMMPAPSPQAPATVPVLTVPQEASPETSAAKKKRRKKRAPSYYRRRSRHKKKDNKE